MFAALGDHGRDGGLGAIVLGSSLGPGVLLAAMDVEAVLPIEALATVLAAEGFVNEELAVIVHVVAVLQGQVHAQSMWGFK